MRNLNPRELVGAVLEIVTRDGWRSDPIAIESLRHCLDGDPFDWRFEFFGIPAGTGIVVIRDGV